MSRKCIFVYATVLCLLTGIAEAQFQRLGIRPQSLKLPANGTPKRVEALCMDKHIPGPPSTGVPYGSVVAGGESAYVVRQSGQRIPFHEAVASNLISVSGVGGSQFASRLELAIKSNLPESLTLEFGKPFVMGPDARQEPITAAALKELSSAEPSQEGVWAAEAAAGMLRVLGYDLGRTAEQNRAAVRTFQRREGLEEDGIIGWQTGTALVERTAEMEAYVAKLGEPEFLSPLDRRIAALQKAEGGEVTGRFDDVFKTQMENRRAFVESLPELARDESVTMFSLLDAAGKLAPVIAIDRQPLGMHVLTRRNGVIEHWVANSDRAMRLEKETLGIRTFAYTAVQNARYSSRADRLFVASGVATDGKVPVAFGPEVIDVPLAQLRAFIAGSASTLPEIDALIKQVKESGIKRPQMVFVHSPLAFARSGIDAELIDAAKMATAVQRAYGRDVDVLIGTDTALADLNAAAIPKVRGGEVQVVQADGVKYNAKVSEISADLKAAGIRTISAAPGEEGGSAPVTIFMGHKDGAYRSAVQKLAEQGVFKDGILVAASCGEAGEAAFNARLIRASGARAVIYYDGEINPDVVQNVLLEFTKRLPKDAASSEDFRTIWNESVRAAAEVEPNAEARDRLQTLVDPLIQVSDALTITSELFA